MEARARLARVSAVVARTLLWATIGLLISLLIAWLLSPRWVDICTPLKYGRIPCAPIDTPRMLGYVTTILGLLLMTIGPVVTTLWMLFRHGYNWETSRVEPAHVNGPILMGIVFFGGGLVIVGLS